MPTRQRKPGCRMLIIAVMFIVMAAVLIIIIAPGILLQVFSFTPRGSVDTFWSELQTQSPEQSTSYPSILISLSTTQMPQITPTATSTATITATSVPRATEFAITHTPSITFTATQVPDTATPAPTPNPYAALFREATIPSSIQVIAEGYLHRSFSPPETYADTLLVGESLEGEALGIIAFPQSAIDGVCATYLNNCRNERYRVDQVDFRLGGIVVHGSINTGLWWQDVGVVMLLSNDRRTLRLGGMIVNGEVYTAPTTGRVAELLNELVNRGNTALTSLQINTGQHNLRILELFIEDDRFVLILS